MGGLDEHRLAFYKTLHAVLEITLSEIKEFSDYEKALRMMYGEENVKIAKELASGDTKFYGLHALSLALEGFVEHKKLLDAYAKVQLAKQKYREGK